MGLVAINTVEIDSANGAAANLRGRLETLLQALNRTSGCVAYTLARRESSSEAWIITGHWDSVERMTEHFHLPCLATLFELAAQRRLSRLCFTTFLLAPSP
ncbi:antibiotic biosynthesis monooxygenase [Pseudomonas guariconensis]|uniref:antibiotic biosynthesis monooxygenase n=1 Tax=Pseudomonas TaxID=286 RepID=UPI001CE41FF6|nr:MULTISPECIES: antibiotic biosynthesis monooxygenase [Pseudomonas]MCO7640245.1 antibiotic biosynthesis monooxygenase [Pseudomonas sp. S 311-6]MCO7515975.1 antibiotic biosynthesis monooxygenase [Pseudomonas putida]MCO7565563.1 antibiotic biosynthesis monooxygenase [Pseudomonas mosselii]MCO7593243.1 antibiotic biosynthesis monooxygenase [Pseudomonas guariconensis]MCO7606426.1 antibiotic biosynthesis monooxygenase [Pseudomonas guariconensis]